MIKVHLRRFLFSTKLIYLVTITSLLVLITLILGFFGIPYKYTIFGAIFIIVCKLIEDYWPTNYTEKVKRLCSKVDEKKYEQALEKIDRLLETNSGSIKAKGDLILAALHSAKAKCLLELGIKYWDQNKLKEAIKIYKEVLEIFKKQGNRKVFYTEQGNMCTTYRWIALITNEKDYLIEAFKRYEVLLNGIIKIEDVAFYGYLKSQIGCSFIQLFYFENNINYLNQAINSYEEAEECFKRKADIYFMKITSGIACRMLFEISRESKYKTKAVKNMEEAIVYYEEAIKDAPIKYFLTDYAWICFCLGVCYSELHRIQKDKEYLQKASAMFCSAQNAFTSIKHDGLINVINSYQNNDIVLL